MNKKGILVVSFGTSYKETRQKTIYQIEQKIKDVFTDYKIYRAFTSKIIINKIFKETKEKIYTVTESLEQMIEDGIKEIIVQPTHIINGIENDQMIEDIKKYMDSFDSIKIGSPLLTYHSDYLNLIKIIKKEFSFLNNDDHLIFMGHGTSHYANSTYPALDYILKDMHCDNIHVATVEGYPELSTVTKLIKKTSCKNIYLVPLMIVAGDHALNDMSDDSNPSSWKNVLKDEGFNVKCILKGLGEFESIQECFVDHIKTSFKLK